MEIDLGPFLDDPSVRTVVAGHSRYSETDRYPIRAIFTDDLHDAELELLARINPDLSFVAATCQQCRRSANLRITTLDPGWFCGCGYFNAYQRGQVYQGGPDEHPDQGPSLARLHAAGFTLRTKIHPLL